MAVSDAGAAPEVAHAGAQIEFAIAGTMITERAVAGGTLAVAVSYRGFHVHSETGPLCAAFACPLAPGTQRVVLRRALPRTAPPVSLGE